MTIDKDKLVDLLVDKTSMNREEVKTQLDQLIERILDAAKRGKALEIKEFGVFYFDEQGELRFDPSDELSTEISFKYAGMKPVELKPERDTSIPEDIDEIEDDAEEAGVEEVGDEEMFPDPFGEADTDEGEESKPVFGAESEETEDEEESPFDFDDEETDDDLISDPFSDESLEQEEEPQAVDQKEESATKIADIKPTASRRPVKRRDNTGIFILIAIVIIAVLIGAYFYYVSLQSQSSVDPMESSPTQMEYGVNENGNTGSNQTDLTTSQAANQETAQNQEASSTEQADANQGTEQGNVPNNAVPVSQTDQDLFGLMGSVVEEANDGYSIVVHSFRNEENAQEAANQLRTDGGYRVIVNSRTVYENQVWRVSVGQFETLSDAQQATTRLPNPYNTQNFIQRIRTN